MDSTPSCRPVLPLLVLAALLLLLAAPASSLALDVAAVPDSAAGDGSGLPGSAVELDEEGRVVVPVPGEKALAYQRGKDRIWIASTLLGFLVPLVVLFSGLAGRLQRWAHGTARRWFFAFALFVLAYTLISAAVTFPLDWYGGFHHEHAFGMSNQAFGDWLGDWVKGLIVSLVMTLLFLWIPLVLIRHHPRRWWLYFALGAIPFIVLMMLIQPIWIAPLFDDFGPMEDKRLEARILALADRAGIEGSRVFQVNKSEDTNAVNAYVTGFGGSKRIVLWDTMVDRLEEEEVLFVMGHEMGHYVLHHIYWMILVVVGIILAGGFLVQVSARSLLARFGPRFEVQKLHEIGALPLILLLFGLASFLLSPLVSAYSRHNERVADIFGLEITRDNTAAAGAFVRLQTSNLSDPYPPAWVTFLRGSHPPLGHRITFINNYRPWEEGEPLRYGHLFEAPPEGGEAAGEAAGSGTP